MDRVPISLISFAVLAVVIIISKYFISKKQLKNIGKVFTIVNLVGDKKKSARRIVISVALALIAFGTISLFFFNEMNPVLVILQASTLGILIYFMDIYNYLHFGERGFYGAGCKFKRIDDVAKVVWDKDLGQLQCGVNIYFKSSGETMKLYIPKEFKKNVESYFEEYIT